MGLSIDDCIHKLDFSIGAYKKLIDENVSNGEVVGTRVRGTWTASTPLNKAYSDMIEALQTAKDTMRKYQKIEQIVSDFREYQKGISCGFGGATYMQMVSEVVEDGTN